MMNELIETIFADFEVDGVTVPVAYMYYDGHDDSYIVYMHQDSSGSISGDDDLIGYVDYYDFDIYSKGNYKAIAQSLKAKLKQHGFVWQLSRSSPDMYETDTGYYHKTLNFAFLREETDNGENWSE